MKKLGKKFLLASLLGATVIGSSVAIATSCSSSGSTGFDSDKIGVYVESEWKPAYEAAVNAYNAKGGHKYQIQLKEEKAFAAFEKIDTLGHNDSQVADLIYTPLDRVPEFATKQALLPFKTADELVKGIDPSVYGSNQAAFTTAGSANVNGTKYYFGIPHNKEALIMFYKGNINPASTFKDLYKGANWTDTMVAAEFKNLWQALGAISGAEGSTSGKAVGDSLIRWDGSKYVSDMTAIKNPNGNKNAEGLKKAVDYVAEYYATTVNKNNSMLGSTNDWLIDGNYGKNIDNCYAKATNAAVIDGPWSLAKFKKDGVTKASVVPNLDTDLPYTQAPGGWLYSINARNEGNTDKINDMKDFINILLTDQTVIKSMFDTAGKITYGDVASGILNKAYSADSLEGQVIKAVADSHALDQRPDNGNDKFGNVWDAWDKNGFGSDEIVKLAKAADNNWTKYEDVLASSFATMLAKVNG